MQFWTSPGYFSNSTGSFVTNCRFSPTIGHTFREGPKKKKAKIHGFLFMLLDVFTHNFRLWLALCTWWIFFLPQNSFSQLYNIKSRTDLCTLTTRNVMCKFWCTCQWSQFKERWYMARAWIRLHKHHTCIPTLNSVLSCSWQPKCTWY